MKRAPRLVQDHAMLYKQFLIITSFKKAIQKLIGNHCKWLQCVLPIWSQSTLGQQGSESIVTDSWLWSSVLHGSQYTAKIGTLSQYSFIVQWQ